MYPENFLCSCPPETGASEPVYHASRKNTIPKNKKITVFCIALYGL
jgi:hypothetical protein